MEENEQNIMIIAGEVSGDLLGGELSRELLQLDNKIKLFGIGGDKMKQAGVEIICHINRLAFLGFAEVIRHIPFVKKVQSDLIKVIKEKNIEHVIMIDYPGFNLNFAKKIKPLGVKILYYVSPQIWAWGIGRMKKIKYLVKKMFVVFPFEEEIYKNAGVDVEFVGHPLLDRINRYEYLSKVEFFEKYNLDPAKDILLILPGSRKFEVEKIFPACMTCRFKIKERI